MTMGILHSVSHKKRREPRCSFCSKSLGDVRKLIAGPDPKLYICDQCVKACYEIVEEEPPADTHDATTHE